ncbi:MAG TPA: DUF4173 domain-containing protein [Thermoguttaceae bacterium]|nr:DUF4173 domain-containing protein [Thermoguttaceae bacterium]
MSTGSEPLQVEREPSDSAEATPTDARGLPFGQAPVRWREILAVLLLIVLADVAVYRAYGFAGFAAFFLAAPLLLWLGAPRPKFGKGCLVLAVMLILAAAKLLWCGSWLLVGCGFALLVAFTMALAGLRPYVLETVAFAWQTFIAGYEGLLHYRRSTDRLAPRIKRGILLDAGLPLVALVAFGLLFIVANPDLLASFGEAVERIAEKLRGWILAVVPDGAEVFFWLAVLWITIGLLRPVVAWTMSDAPRAELVDDEAGPSPADSPFYVPFRNTLLTLIVLFAVYLVFEFKTLWFRVFPEGFHYSGYAHEGAAWLTVALALATVVLSLIFRGRILHDLRSGRLRRLAWIWSLENGLLAVAVYHRLTIYIGFNGMTRMRTVGVFGMTCVVAGFVLVIWKIVRNRDFVWLMRGQLWALALTVYLFALTPVDALVTSYNVRRILAGDPAPSVEISVHPIDSQGVLRLLPLVECDDEIIREGVRAMLASRRDRAEARALECDEQGWTANQIADRLLLEKLRGASGDWAEYTDLEKREAALDRFHEYAYQWY